MAKIRRVVRKIRANPQQEEFAKLVGGEGWNPTEAARKVWPNAKASNQRAHQALKSPGVKILIQKYQLKNVRHDASRIAYETLREVAEDKDEAGSARAKAAVELHNNFGFGRIKDEDGQPLQLEDMEEDELDDFIERAEKRIRSEEKATILLEAEIVDIEKEDPEEEKKQTAEEIFGVKTVDSEKTED